MCECGCASTRLRHAKLDIKGHPYVYTVALHPGCPDCCTGPAFMLERYTRQDARSFDIPDLPKVEFDSGGCHFIPGVEPGQLLKAMNTECEWVEDMFHEEADDGEMAKVLHAAAYATVEQFEKEAKRGR